MPRVIDIADDGVISLDECAEAMAAQGFNPADEDSLAHGALMLRRLGNNKSFLGDILVDYLEAHHRDDPLDNSYGPQVVMLARPDPASNCFLRANIWPSRDEHMMRASGGDAFVYGLPHDHNFNFMTLGYFGPGYWSDYYEFDYEDVVGWRGEKVDLRFIGRERGIGCGPVSMRSSNAGPRTGGSPGGGPASTSAYSAARAAESGGSPSSEGNEKAGPSAAKVRWPTKSSVPSAQVVAASARPASVSSAQAAAAAAAKVATAAGRPPGDDQPLRINWPTRSALRDSNQS